MSRLRVAVVGGGRAGTLHARNVADYAARAEVVAVVDELAAAAEALAREVGGPPLARGGSRWRRPRRRRRLHADIHAP